MRKRDLGFNVLWFPYRNVDQIATLLLSLTLTCIYIFIYICIDIFITRTMSLNVYTMNYKHAVVKEIILYFIYIFIHIYEHG